MAILALSERIYREWGKFQESEDAIRKGIDLAPCGSYAWTELGLLLMDRKLFKKAADCLRKSVQLRPDFNTYTILAAVEFTFDVDAALLDAERALEINPDWDEAMQVRDDAQKAIKKRDDE